MKKFHLAVRFVTALAASFAFILGSATVLNVAESAQAAPTAFTCTPDFYQVSAGNIYHYSVPSNTYTVMSGSTNIAGGLNAIGYNPGDNFIYGLGKTTTTSALGLFQIASDGSHGAEIPLTGVTPSSTAGDFIGANQLLTVTNTGVWTLVNTSTDVVTSYTEAGSTWKAYDFAYNPTTGVGYGMQGTTLYIGVVSGTTVTVSTKTVTGTLAGTNDNWGAAYVDSSGDGYFFDNNTFNLVEIGATGTNSMASATPAALSITTANSLASPNDGASCATASSPLAPTVTTGAATSVTTTSATLNGSVMTGIPASSNVTTGNIVMCYSTSSTVVNGALSVSPVCAPTTPSSMAANSTQAVTLGVSGLSSGSTYYYQLEATNAYGLEGFGAVMTLNTVAVNHTVTFNNNGGAGTMANETNNAATALTADTFTRTGYTFAGWNTAANGTGTAYADSASYPFTADATLYAQWTALPNHTVTFNNNGGTGTMANEVNNVPANLTSDSFTRAGYTFNGWNTAANGSGTAYADAASYSFAADVTLYAQWTAIPNKTVTFDNNGGSGTMSNEAANVPTALAANSFTRTGYSFAGWNTAANGSGTAYANTATYPFSADATLYAQWTALPNHTVIFNNNGGTSTMANEVNNVATALTTDTFTRIGYAFSGWNTAANGTGTAYADNSSYPFSADTTLYAQWTALPNHTVTFDNNGGSGVMSSEVANQPTALTTNTMTRAGYTFAGWNTQANGLGVAYADGASYPFNVDATLFAQWTAIPTKTVTFDNNGGTGTMSNEVANVPTALSSDTFTRAGYTFAGWNTAANGTGTAYANSASYSFAADATMYAQWTVIPNKTVTFDNNGGTGTMANEAANVPTALTADTFTRTGYTFAGWNTAANGSGTAYADTSTFPFGADATLYAQWTPIASKTVTFDNNGGTGTMSNEVANVPTALTSDTFTRSGYTFNGWNTAANGSGTAYTDGASYSFAADATLYAQWTAIPNKTVTFDNNGGTGTMSNQSDNVPTALIPDTFTRTGYTFAGWNTAANGTGTGYADTASFPFGSDATLYAQWTPIAAKTVTFDNNGGSGTMSDEVANGPTALTTDSFTRSGYTFGGWNTAANGTGTAYADGSSYSFAADATMFAQWTAIPNKTVSFDNNGGSGTMADELANVPTALTADAFTRTGYTFGGWNTAANGTGTAYADAATFPFSSDATLYAQWTAIPNKTVSFNNNGGTGTMSNEVANVPTALSSGTFTRAGYTFGGWNTAANGTGTAYADAATYPFSADASLYAQWTPIAAKTVTFDNNGGTGTMSNEVANVPTALSLDSFTRAGYSFAGWNTANDGSGTDYADGASFPFSADATLYAKWTPLPNKTVTFDNNGGSGSMSNEVANLPTNLTADSFTRSGFTFAGWNTAANGSGTSYADTASFPFSSNATLYAQWTAIPTKTVTFDNNGGAGTMANQVDNVPTALTTDTFTRSGYTFIGWNTAANGTGTGYTDGASYSFAADATLYAQWTNLPTKTVTFNNNGGSGSMANEANNVPAALTADSFTRAGYTFAGWNTAANGTGTAYADAASYPFGADATLYAQWTAIPNKTVTFNNNGGAGTMSNQSDNVPTALIPGTFTRAGYTFTGWNTAANGSGAPYADGSSYSFGSDATMYAQWTQLAVLTFNSNGGTGSVASITSGVPTTLPTTTVARPGYTFTGWNTSPDGTGTSYAPGALYPFTGNGTLYAQFTKILAFTGFDATPSLTLGLLLLGLGLAVSAVAFVSRKLRKRGAHATW